MTRDERLAGGLGAYFQLLGGASDPLESRLAALAGGELDDDEHAVRVELGEAGMDAWHADMEVIRGAWGASADVVPLPGRVRPWRYAVATVAAAAAVVLVIWTVSPEGDPARHAPSPTDVQLKGDLMAGEWELHAAVKRGDLAFTIGDGSTLQTGDRLGLFYSASTAGHLVVVYADAQGSVVRLFPSGPSSATKIDPGHEIRLPAGATLTAGTGCEWLVGRFDPRPLDPDRVANEVRRMVVERRGCLLTSPELRKPGYRVLVVHR